MKLFKFLLASLAFVAVSAQANTISTSVNIFSPNNEVGYINFNVTDAGSFTIFTEESNTLFLNPHALLFTSPLSDANLIGSNDNINFLNNNSRFTLNLGLGSYVLAVSDSVLTLNEALSGYNSDVINFLTSGTLNVTISSQNGVAAFGNPSAVPVPAAAWLFGSALLGFAGFRRKSV